MVAKELIDRVVVKEYRKVAHVRAITEDSWWHVHGDEELPDNYPVVVYVRIPRG